MLLLYYRVIFADSLGLGRLNGEKLFSDRIEFAHEIFGEAKLNTQKIATNCDAYC